MLRQAPGSHEIWWNPANRQFTTIPRHASRDIRKGTLRAILRDLGWPLLIVLPLALLVGFLLMMRVFWFMSFLYSLRQRGNLDYAYAIGETGTVYLPIPPERAGPGKIEVLVQGRLKVVDAFTRSEQRLENRSKVRVLDVIGENALLVEPLE